MDVVSVKVRGGQLNAPSRLGRHLQLEKSANEGVYIPWESFEEEMRTALKPWTARRESWSAV